MRIFFFFFFFFFLLFTFENDGNLFWMYQNGNFLPGKNISSRGKKSGKMALPPQKNMPVTPLVRLKIVHSKIKKAKSSVG